ncbi:MAG: hypothetical protein IT203_09755 [Fimbriimonadaceae bacterium]|nr:hypothetical protein [Fimbriimonadaceae bacterium]
MALTALAGFVVSVAFSSGTPMLPLAAILAVAVLLMLFSRKILPFGEHRRRRFEAPVIFVVFFVLFSVLHPMQPPMGKAQAMRCLSNVKQIAVGTVLYAADYDERLPIADVWQDSIAEYFKSKETFKCPVAASPESYAFNSAASGRDSTKVDRPEEAVMEFEADAFARNAHGGPEWFATRHIGKGNLAYVDSHARKLDRRTAMKSSWYSK